MTIQSDTCQEQCSLSLDMNQHNDKESWYYANSVHSCVEEIDPAEMDTICVCDEMNSSVRVYNNCWYSDGCHKVTHLPSSSLLKFIESKSSYYNNAKTLSTRQQQTSSVWASFCETETSRHTQKLHEHARHTHAQHTRHLYIHSTVEIPLNFGDNIEVIDQKLYNYILRLWKRYSKL